MLGTHSQNAGRTDPAPLDFQGPAEDVDRLNLERFLLSSIFVREYPAVSLEVSHIEAQRWSRSLRVDS